MSEDQLYDELFYPADWNGFTSSSHRLMMSDLRRLRVFRRAINLAVSAGDTVIDAGTGTGVLAFYSWQAGAKTVIGLDSSPVIEFAKRTAERNFPGSNIAFRKVGLESKSLERYSADVVICELIGQFGIDEDILQASRRLRKCLRNKRSKMIPRTISLYACPINSATIYSNISFWSKKITGIDCSSMIEAAHRTIYSAAGGGALRLGSARELGSLDLVRDEQLPPLEAEFRVNKSGLLHGFLGWFSADLGDGVTLSTAPRKNNPYHWTQVFFPIGNPVFLKRGWKLSLSIKIHGRASSGRWTWQGTIQDKNSRRLDSFNFANLL